MREDTAVLVLQPAKSVIRADLLAPNTQNLTKKKGGPKKPALLIPRESGLLTERDPVVF